MDFFYSLIIIIGLTILLIFVRIQVENYREAKRFERLVMKILERTNREWMDKFEQAIKKSFEDERMKKIWIDYAYKQANENKNGA